MPRPGANPVPVVCSGVPFCAQHRRIYLSDSLRRTSDMVACRCLRSADTMTLQVPSTRRDYMAGGCSASMEQSV